MTLKTLAAASCITLAMATSTFAAPISLDFKFSVYKGTFYGLDDADGTSSATSFDLSFANISWTDISSSTASSNEFSFIDGKLTSIFFNFLSVPAIQSNDPLFVFRLSRFDLSDAGSSRIGRVTLKAHTSAVRFRAGRDVTLDINPVAAVPLPAGGLLLLSGLGAVGALKRRKKRAA